MRHAAGDERGDAGRGPAGADARGSGSEGLGFSRSEPARLARRGGRPVAALRIGKLLSLSLHPHYSGFGTVLGCVCVCGCCVVVIV